jgi:hypothetical protein
MRRGMKRREGGIELGDKGRKNGRREEEEYSIRYNKI